MTIRDMNVYARSTICEFVISARYLYFLGNLEILPNSYGSALKIMRGCS